LRSHINGSSDISQWAASPGMTAMSRNHTIFLSLLNFASDHFKAMLRIRRLP
jgi:hypothetical protein